MQENGGASKAQVGGSSWSSSSAPAYSPESRKRKVESQAEPLVTPDHGSTSDPVQPDVVVDPMQGPEFWKFGSTQRFGEVYPQHGYQTMQEAKQQRINLADVVIDEMEKCTTTIRTLNDDLEMIICEEKVDRSYVENTQADLLEDAITNVGGVRAQLDDRVASCMLQALCHTDSDGVSGVQSVDPAE